MPIQRIAIKKGLDLPIEGKPDQVITDKKGTSQVALLGEDYMGTKPHLAVSAGDAVRLGDVLFYDKNRPSIRYTSPGSGRVTAINRAERRKLVSVVISLEGNDEVTFQPYDISDLSSLDRTSVSSLLLESGLWTSIRARPFGRVADPAVSPHSIFITAMDTNPLAPSVEAVLNGKEKDFINGLTVLSRLTDGKLFLCKSPGALIPAPDIKSLSIYEFSGPHPSGNAGTHIHFVDPASRNNQVWHVNAQDVSAIGHLFTTGAISTERTISVAGPSVKNPRLVKTRLGASIDDILSGELEAGDNRIISGSVLSGFSASEHTAFLGRFHQQVSVLPEGRKRNFLGWLTPGINIFSTMNIALSRFLPDRTFNFTTSQNGEKRAIVPVDSYERVMPLDILPTFLLKALASYDIEEAEKLGCLELDEEDLSLCTFVCPSKNDYGSMLRHNLKLIEKEG